MKVLVAGSLHFEETEAKRDTFIIACRDLGRALAQAGCELVVGSESPDTADKYVVEGFIEEPGNHKICILRPEDEKKEPPFFKEREAYQDRIEFIYKLIRGPWVSARVPQILAADAVILIGGGRGTAQVGSVAPALERPVVVIPSFGGAAADLWQTFEPFYEKLGTLSEKIGVLRVTWQSSNAKIVIQVLQELLHLKLFQLKRERSAPQIVFLLSMLLLLGQYFGQFLN